jgi:small-conductance mechanosensitive channel
MSNIHLHLHCAGHYEISIRLEDESLAGQIDTLSAKLDQLGQKADTIMISNDALKEQVARIDAIVPSITTFLNGKNQQLDDANARIQQLLAGDAAAQAEVDQMFGTLKTDADQITAITSGTPADPNADPNAPPAQPGA